MAVLYFLALFEVSLDSIVKGQPSCACFGKALVSPWVTGVFDLAALLLLMAAPLSPTSGGARQWYRWLGLAGGFSAFGVLSLIAMWDYSTLDATPAMRGEFQLNRAVTLQRLQPTTEDLLEFCRRATGLRLTADRRLQDRQPAYGVFDAKNVQVWSVMEIIARRQMLPARWEKVDGGYALVPAAPFGKRFRFWFNGVALLFLSTMAVRSIGDPKQRREGKQRSQPLIPETIGDVARS